MIERNHANQLTIAANQNIKERDYWLKKLSGGPGKSCFPYDHTGKNTNEHYPDSVEFGFTGELFSQLMSLRNESDQRLNMILITGVVLMLDKYSGNKDIILGSPIYKPDIEGEFINTIIMLRARFHDHTTFKELLLQVRQTVIEAAENQDYPIEILLEQLNGNDSLLFDVVVLLENIHDKQHIRHIHPNVIFSFLRKEKYIEGRVEYNSALYRGSTIKRMIGHLTHLLETCLLNINLQVGSLELLTEAEKKQLLFDFNNTGKEYPKEKTIQQLFEEQVEKTPGNTALRFNRDRLTYKQLNEKSNQLAGILKKNGVNGETVVGIMLERSIDMIVSLMAILKAGGAYLPITPGLPGKRIIYMLRDSGAKVLITTTGKIKGISLTALQDFASHRHTEIIVTNPGSHIEDFNRLPIPDRSLVKLKNYRDKIGMASAANCISLQATRGCPYQCLFCHKVWSKNHVYRSAENIYGEIEYYYKNGVRNFAFIDDCFNLNRDNSVRFFKSIIKNKPDIRLFFPNGLRGDIMTPDYVDLMVEAGTRGINLSLETASPRLQKLIKKNLDIEKFRQAIEYIAGQHPEVILEIATMHGFPGETEEEALNTLDFIKSIKWLHFPYIHILKIYPNTEMEAFALEQGIAKQDIMASKNLAYHELPETLPFPKNFTRQYQADFMNEYFLKKERLKKVLPVQMKILSSDALVQKYNTYLPVEINGIEDILNFTGLDEKEISQRHPPEKIDPPPIFTKEMMEKEKPIPGKKILFLDLSQQFSSYSMLYNVSEQPLGLIYLLTYLKQKFGNKIDGRIYKSGIDFDGSEELETIVREYKPDLVGIRTLTFYAEFFHETVSLLRQWGIDVPLIAGGPYATSDYDTILKDQNVDLVVLGEGEHTLGELIEKMLENKTGFAIPPADVLKNIPGIAFAPKRAPAAGTRRVLLLDQPGHRITRQDAGNPGPISQGNHLAYVMYTSGSTGQPKGVTIEHRQVNNCISWMQDQFNLNANDVIIQRTNLTFDPSVWEIFWPLHIGGSVKLITGDQSKDADFLIRLMTESTGLTMMYCPSTLVKAMTDVLDNKPVKPVLKLPWLIIGAEPIGMDVVKKFYSYYKGKIVNTYGPTECTINNTYFELEPGDRRSIVPIGKPIANNKIYILSGDLQLQPVKVAGEICIAGASVARGYINNPGKTDLAFIKNPFAGGKLYRSGDIGRWLEDGTIEMLGRVDQQVKIRGYRVELGEIETGLLTHPSIKEARVVVRDNTPPRQKIATCKKCGITSVYPGVNISKDRFCEVCENFNQTGKYLDNYFKTPDDLALEIHEQNKRKKGEYDCLLLYSGGRGSAYALYQLVDRGFNVLTVTYDNGYFTKVDLENIKKITAELGVTNVVLTHKNSDEIMKASMKAAATVCRGCFHTSAALAGEYAYKNNIKVVVGATLSRGQIIENKLYLLLQQGITAVKELEEEVLKITRSGPIIDKEIFDYIHIDGIQDGSIYDTVRFIDFYRYCNITNEEMIAYLNNKDHYWKTRKTFAVYSTNCPLKQVGDFAHLQEKGYHYYGSATGWEKRLGHITLENLKEDLQCHVSQKGCENFLKRIGYSREKTIEKTGKYLCAYFVSEERLTGTQLRESLSERLPDYMIPAHFVSLDRIPLNPDGKLDIKALPAPELKIETEYEAPGNEIERKLAEIWSEVLGIEKIGINDNFFEMGGDSIKTIQVSAKTQRYNLKVKINDVFLNPTIKQLGKAVKEMNREIDQKIAAGEVEITPIQKWFFEKNFKDKNHFNQSLIKYRQQGYDEEIVEKVFAKIVEHHDALRMSFKIEKDNILQKNRGMEGQLFHLEIVDLTDKENPGKEIVKTANRIQRSINLETGPLVKLGLFRTDIGDLLLIVIHHTVIDGVSWRILLEDFEIGYRQAEKGEEIKFQNKTDSFLKWSQKLKEYAETEKALVELEYWKKIEKVKVKPLPRDHEVEKEKKKVKNNDVVSISLNKKETGKLLKEVNWAYNTEINDILLTALGMALEEWSGNKQILINLEGHGREEIIDDMDISRTVGWFTIQYPVLLDMKTPSNNPPNQSAELKHQIQQVKETLRQVPNKGIGRGILKYLTPAQKKGNLTFDNQPEISFNYLGQTD